MNVYRIIGGDGKEYGPITSDQMRQWLAENRVNAQTQARLEGESDWKPLAAFPEFAEPLAQSSGWPQSASVTAAPAAMADLLAADYALDIGECISRSWDMVRNNFATVVGGAAIYWLIQIGVGLIGKIPILGSIVSLAEFVFVAGPLQAGLYYFLLKNLRGQPVEVGDIFSGFRLNYLQIVLSYVVMMLIIVCVALPGGTAAGFSIFEMVKHRSMDPMHSMVSAVGFLVAIIPMMYLSISWIFALALVPDRGMGFWDALELSRKMVGKHWWTVFGLLVVCGLVQIAGMCACCVGVLVSTPVAFGAIMCAYERIFTASRTPAV